MNKDEANKEINKRFGNALRKLSDITPPKPAAIIGNKNCCDKCSDWEPEAPNGWCNNTSCKCHDPKGENDWEALLMSIVRKNGIGVSATDDLFACFRSLLAAEKNKWKEDSLADHDDGICEGIKLERARIKKLIEGMKVEVSGGFKKISNIEYAHNKALDDLLKQI
jgi:hypothetical protein